ncbi:DNA/RNA polymerase [Metschnikowia bicuspidata]|uniref:DNA-directed RNA polymerase n=1 Tax=Metschnikowia bicuspidata TaxID=27322 RepID=A0A4P9ZCD4_9ASCO|nr:DNA/RNA polymerase [Metschnikowia bicuspidata]
MRPSSRTAPVLQRALHNRCVLRHNHGAAALSPTEQPVRYDANLDKRSLYAHLFEGLQKQPPCAAPKTYAKSFYEIKPQNNDAELRAHAGRRIPYSSAFDRVTRTPFAKDVAHLQSLLDALLASRNLLRAENILAAMVPLVDDAVLGRLVDGYLEALAHEDALSVDDVAAFLERMPRDYNVQPSERAYAIATARAVRDGEPMRFVRGLLRQPLRLQRVFAHVDVLSLEQLSAVFLQAEVLRKHVPRELQLLYDEARGRPASPASPTISNTYFVNRDSPAPSVAADRTEVRAVDSFGLTVIRHMLLGLESADQSDLDELLRSMDLALDEHVLHGAGKRQNFHEVYRLLQLQQDRDKFNAALDTYNLARQKQLESKGLDAAREKWCHEFDKMKRRGDVAVTKSFNAQLYQWYLDVLPEIEAEAARCRDLLAGKVDVAALDPNARAQWKERAVYAPFLLLLPAKQLAVITLLELIKLNSTGGIVDGMRTARAVISVGRAVELEYRSRGLAARDTKTALLKNSRLWRHSSTVTKSASISNGELADWDLPVCAKLGSVLVAFVMRTAKVPVVGTDPASGKPVHARQPAFYHTYQFVSGQRLGIIRLHKVLVAHLAGTSMANAVQPQLLPMLVQPREWTLSEGGGYRFMQSHLVRVKDSAETVAYVKAAAEAGDLDMVYRGLNVLGNTPWTINARVLAVITRYWNTGLAFLDIPPVCDEPELSPPLPHNAEPQAKAEYYKKVRSVLTEAATFRSQRCDANYKLEIARAFVGEKVYFPHNIDFRGRAYPILPHLNHLGNDMTRALFLFWDGRPLGVAGLHWLKIHLANLYGMDKAPLAEREAWVDRHKEQIKRVAEDPCAQEAWWAAADKPWQVLAVCYELADAHKLADPTQYRSHIPVHQDGTCNGLQHYAALGGDVEGARQVNLLPAERPKDVYQFVALLVEKRLDAEAAAGNDLAQFMRGKISRKVVKQTVMTNVYGVTFVGAVAQIEKQMDTWFAKDDFKLRHAHSTYLTALVFECMRELFLGAHLIQDWLGEAAKRISKSVRTDHVVDDVPDPKKPLHMSSVVWTTPLGLPCVQPYRAVNKQVVPTLLQDITITDPYAAMQVDARKQCTAFPPNYIHSLDATHMLLTAAACGDAGLHFALVHDSYWTHACDVDTMNRIIRDQFVALHKDNLILKLRDEFERRYRGFLYAVHIDGTHELAKKIRAVKRRVVQTLGRGMTLADEIALETKRQLLLLSPSLHDNRLGREMETTISVTESYDIDSIKVLPSKSKAVQILVPLTFPPIPPRGELDVEVVKQASYFFS